MKNNLFNFCITFLICLQYVRHTNAQINCADAPTPAAKIVCEQLHKWDTNAREAPPVTTKIVLPPSIPGLPTPMMAAELAPIASTPYQCMDLGCLCSYMGGNGQQGSNACTLPNGRQLTKAVRKEYRMLSDDERNRFHAALLQLKNSGEYDRVGIIHSQFAKSGGAHSGPAFLPWHREYIKRIEIAIRQIDPTLALPYWDSTLDSHLMFPKDSIIWTDDFMGTTDASGNVVTGTFARWRTTTGRPNILRRVGAQGTVLQDSEVNYVMQQTQVENVLAFTAPRQGCAVRTSWNVLEYTHGNVHIFIGGDMLDQSTSANDPIFFLHHSFVDLIWENWRQLRQNRFDRENAFPLDMQLCSSAMHFGSALMRPFEPWRNVDGLNNKYTDNMFQYEPRPTCSAVKPSCGSKYLFCDRSHGAPRCTSKVKLGGACNGFSLGEDICYNSICQGGRCVAGGVQQATTQKPRTAPVTFPPKVVAPPSNNCYNEHECCSTWSSKGECQRNSGYMNAWCKASCGKCRPSYDLVNECSDRHPNCAKWARSNECARNAIWMAENCRKSCNKCSQTRTAVCSGSRGKTTATKPDLPQAPTVSRPQSLSKCDSPGCYNENVCCQFWGLSGQCARNASWMSCNCRVSCGYCIPQEYSYGSCEDYHRDCRRWAMNGECNKNGWMLENCRLSCQSCFSGFELRQMCRGSEGGRFSRGDFRDPQMIPPPFDFFGSKRKRVIRDITGSDQPEQEVQFLKNDFLFAIESRGMPAF